MPAKGVHDSPGVQLSAPWRSFNKANSLASVSTVFPLADLQVACQPDLCPCPDPMFDSTPGLLCPYILPATSLVPDYHCLSDSQLQVQLHVMCFWERLTRGNQQGMPKHYPHHPLKSDHVQTEHAVCACEVAVSYRTLQSTLFLP